VVNTRQKSAEVDQSVSPRYDIVARRCTILAGRYRWDIRQSGLPIRSSMDSFAGEQEVHENGRREMENVMRRVED
jgi:hypothetical protein